MTVPKTIALARLQGTSARQCGKPREANPYQNKASLRNEADAWLSGWQQQAALIGRGK